MLLARRVVRAAAGIVRPFQRPFHFRRSRPDRGFRVRPRNFVLRASMCTVAPAAGESLKIWNWKEDPAVSFDENMMRLALVVSRNSICVNGHMGALIAKDGKVLVRAINSPLFKPMKSDVHAEVNAIGWCARNGMGTEGATCYVTMPPCRKCLTVLVSAGIKKIVTRRDFGSVVGTVKMAQERGIELVHLPDDEERIKSVQASIELDESEKKRVSELREARKAMRKARRSAKRCRDTETAEQDMAVEGKTPQNVGDNVAKQARTDGGAGAVGAA